MINRTRNLLLVCGALALIIVLAFSHRFAYISAKAAAADQFNEQFASENADWLDKGTKVLEVAQTHPEAFTSQDLRYWKTNVGNWSASVARVAIPYWQRQGKTAKVAEATVLVERAHAILARLPK